MRPLCHFLQLLIVFSLVCGCRAPGWRLKRSTYFEDAQGGITFFGESGPCSSAGAALEAATLNALARASRTREVQITSFTKLRSGETHRSSSLGGNQSSSEYEFLENTRMLSQASFTHTETLDQQVLGESPDVRARVHIRLMSDQVLIHKALRKRMQLPLPQRIESLRTFVDEARVSRAPMVQALGLVELLAIEPNLDDVLALIDATEDLGRADNAILIARRWQGRVTDPKGLIEHRVTNLRASLENAQALLARLVGALVGARHSHTSVQHSPTTVSRKGPTTQVRLTATVRPGQPVSLLWIDQTSICAPTNLVFAPGEIESTFDRVIADWADDTGEFVPGDVQLALLAGDLGDPAPLLEPEVRLPAPGQKLSLADQNRLKGYTEELRQWLGRGTNEAVLVHWKQE